MPSTSDRPPRSRGASRLSGGTGVALAMVAMNAALYAFNVVAARLLTPAEFGALTALLGVILVGNVASLGLQTTTARRIAVDRAHASSVVATTTRVTLLVAACVGLAIALFSPLAERLLKLDSVWPTILCGAALVPLTIMGAQAGVAQGSERWGSLSAIYAANGVGRLVGGSVAVVVDPSTTSAMVGIAVGSWLPVLVGARMLGGHQDEHSPSRRNLLHEVTAGSHALLAFFVLSNLDALVARNLLSPHDSGLYAAGLILAKAALFFPQFISVVLFPALARADGGRARERALLLVCALGVVAVGATALLPHVALILVGGSEYAEISSRLWLFALAGSLLAVVHLLVFDALARRAHGIVPLLWLGSAAILVSAYGLRVHLTGLVTIVCVVAGTVALLAWYLPRRTLR